MHTVTSHCRKYLVADQSIDCSTAKYLSYRLMAQLALLVYGLGIPLVYVLMVKREWGKRGYQQTYVMYIFLLGGFRAKTWYWQAVIMLRKLTIGLIAVFISVNDDNDATNDNLQSYVAIYVISAFMGLQLYCKPYTDGGITNAPYNWLESLSLGVTVFTPQPGADVQLGREHRCCQETHHGCAVWCDLCDADRLCLLHRADFDPNCDGCL